MRISYYVSGNGRIPVREYFAGLPERDRESVFGDLELVGECKNARQIPLTGVATRHIRDKLWEIKSGQGRKQRIFYVVATGPEMILLHGCKKQKGKAEKRHLSIAHKRAREVLL